ncbi:hypothetical protein V6N11_058746 [Hibiscus sabdariffa]|uniref:Uncharacterized protein n=1 Tax=Hibiscus sabdariffa TaxID=183260 RepID=A0ABR2U5F3_9ROSI
MPQFHIRLVLSQKHNIEGIISMFSSLPHSSENGPHHDSKSSTPKALPHLGSEGSTPTYVGSSVSGALPHSILTTSLEDFTLSPGAYSSTYALKYSP